MNTIKGNQGHMLTLMRCTIISFGAVITASLGTGCGDDSPRPADDRAISPPAPTVATAPERAAGETATLRSPVDTPAGGSATADLKTASFCGWTGPKPATWIMHPAQGFNRVVRYTVPGRNGAEAADIVVSCFGPGLGGTREMNIERWKNQFRSAEGGPVEPRIEELELAGAPATLIELAGSWLQAGAASHTPDQLFLTALIETPANRIIVRFAGQTATVETNRTAFLEFLRGLRPVDAP
jgi:hypothetical protein